MNTNPITMTIVSEPTFLGPDHKRPGQTREVTIGELCNAAQISCRVTGGVGPKILLHRGQEHMRCPSTFFVGAGTVRRSLSRETALRILEALAYGFMDYRARESVCGRGLYVPKKPAGRPPRLGRPRTAAERMRDMRARRQS